MGDPKARRVFEVALFKVEHGKPLLGVRERRLSGLRNRVAQVERGAGAHRHRPVQAITVKATDDGDLAVDAFPLRRNGEAHLAVLELDF